MAVGDKGADVNRVTISFVSERDYLHSCRSYIKPTARHRVFLVQPQKQYLRLGFIYSILPTGTSKLFNVDQMIKHIIFKLSNAAFYFFFDITFRRM